MTNLRVSRDGWRLKLCVEIRRSLSPIVRFGRAAAARFHMHQTLLWPFQRIPTTKGLVGNNSFGTNLLRQSLSLLLSAERSSRMAFPQGKFKGLTFFVGGDNRWGFKFDNLSLLWPSEESFCCDLFVACLHGKVHKPTLISIKPVGTGITVSHSKTHIRN